jgi:hypothetical protein
MTRVARRRGEAGIRIPAPHIAIIAAASFLLPTPALAQGGASWAVGDGAVRPDPAKR